MLILDPVDRFALERGLAGPSPRPIAAVRFLLARRADPGTHASAKLSPPLELLTTINAGGYHLFYGKFKRDNSSAGILAPEGWPWTLRAISPVYQTADVTPTIVPAAFPLGSGNVPIRFDLSPGPAYPFPDDPPGHRAIRLRGTVRDSTGQGVEGVTIAALDGSGHPQPHPAISGADGQWVMTFPNLPAGRKVNLRFALLDGAIKDVEATLKDGIENNLPFQTA